MVNEIVASRIERAQAGLAQSVQASDGAHFRLLLSLISSNELYGYQNARQADNAPTSIPSEQLSYIAPDQLYSPATVERINEGLQHRQMGEVAYALAWIDTQANTPRHTQAYNRLPNPESILSMIA